MECCSSENYECGCCKNELVLDKLCSRKIKTCMLWAEDIELGNKFCAQELSSPQICAGQVTTDKIDANTACITNLNTSNQCAQAITATSIGVSNLVANNLCVPGALQVSNLINCGKYRAAATFNSITTNILGSPLNFNTILDDPNNNVSLSPFAYNIPVPGYYMIVLQVNIQNVQLAISPVLGLPAGDPQIFVNGVVVAEEFSLFLNYYPVQRGFVSTMLNLKAGDKVTANYNLLTLTSSTGIVVGSGTVDIVGNGTDVNTTAIKIHLLSTTCSPINPNNPPMCPPSVPCVPCTPMQCTPCVPTVSVPSGSSM
jgi:hypothetical protein